MNGLRQKIARKAGKIVRAQQAPVPGDQPAPPAPKGPAAPAGPGGGVPPAPPKAGPPGPQEEEPKKEDKSESKMEEKLDKVIDALDTMTKALEDQKKIMEKTLLDETETEEKFDKFKDKEDDDDIEEFDSDEFGVDTDSLIVSTEEESMSVKGLREAREKRLAKTAAMDKEVETISEEFDEEKAKKKTFKPSAPAPQITKVKKSEIPDMFVKMSQLALELNDDNTKWTVMKTDESGEDTPLYEIDKTNENAENFATEDFAKDVFQAMKEKGVKAALEMHGAKVVTAEEKGSVELKEEPKSDDYKRRFNRAFRLAMTAMTKNLVNNPLKGAIYENFTKLGLDEQDVYNAIESAFETANEDHLETALSETEKYMEMGDESFIETEAAIGSLETYKHEVTSSRKELDDYSEELKTRAIRGSLPISTRTAADATDKYASLKDALPTPKLSGIRKLALDQGL